MQDDVSKQVNAIELICKQCGKKFVYRTYQQKERINRKKGYPCLCYTCLRKHRKMVKQKQQNIENKKREIDKAEETEKFVEYLNRWKVVNYRDVVPANNKVLYIIGNGFDLMHGVNSSYRDFGSTLGKNGR